MKMTVADFRRLSHDILTRRGLEEKEAAIITDILLEAELRGRQTHGFIRLPKIAEQCSAGGWKAISVTRDGPAYALIDGAGNLGYLVAHRCTQMAMEKAKASGVGIVGAFNSGHCGMLGYYATAVADAGLVGLAMCDTSPRIVPTGGKQRVLGTNPIAAGFPSGNGQILVDFSTAAITNGQILVALKNGSAIPGGCALDPEGNATTDPESAMRGSVVAFGGHKGYALAVMVQVFSGILVNAAVVPEPGKNYGFFVLAISPSIFLNDSVFRAGVDELIRELKWAGVAEGSSEILVPGERAFRERKKRLEEGIEVDEAFVDELKRLTHSK
jgi:L-2-hydroxycarboxylate dehydrogenase (NAD+)